VENNLPKHAQEIYKEARNSAEEQYGEEDRAHRVAWRAVEQKYEKNEMGEWVSKEDRYRAASSPTEVLRSPKRLACLAAAAFYSPELRVECAEVHMDIPIFSNIGGLQYVLPVPLQYRFLVRMCITTSLDRRVLSRRDKRPKSRPSQPRDRIRMRLGIHYIHPLMCLYKYQERLQRSSRRLQLVREKGMALNPLLFE
jgi:cation transport regulator